MTSVNSSVSSNAVTSENVTLATAVTDTANITSDSTTMATISEAFNYVTIIVICAAVAAIILIPLAICFTLEQCEYFETNKSAKKKHKKSHADANGFTNASTDLPARNLRANEDTLTQLSEYQPSPSLPGEIGLQYNDNIQYRAKTSFSLGANQHQANKGRGKPRWSQDDDEDGYLILNNEHIRVHGPVPLPSHHVYVNDGYLGAANEDLNERVPTTTRNPTAYPKTNKYLRPEKMPASTKPYSRHQMDWQETSQPYEQPMHISLGDERLVPEPKVKKPGVAVAMGTFDPHELLREDEDKMPPEKVKVVIPKDLNVDYTPKPLELQTVKYENPKIESRKRKEQILEEIRRKEAAKRNAKRIKTQSNGMEQQPQVSKSSYPETRVASQPLPPRPTGRNSTLDSFLF